MACLSELLLAYPLQARLNHMRLEPALRQLLRPDLPPLSA